MSRNFDQILRSQENGWSKTLEVSTGTASVSVAADPGHIHNVTDISVSNSQAVAVSILNGTANLYQLSIPANPNPSFAHSFKTNLRSSNGTAIIAEVAGVTGIVKVNLSGYTD